MTCECSLSIARPISLFLLSISYITTIYHMPNILKASSDLMRQFSITLLSHSRPDFAWSSIISIPIFLILNLWPSSVFVWPISSTVHKYIFNRSLRFRALFTLFYLTHDCHSSHFTHLRTFYRVSHILALANFLILTSRFVLLIVHLPLCLYSSGFLFFLHLLAARKSTPLGSLPHKSLSIFCMSASQLIDLLTPRCIPHPTHLKIESL